MRTTRTTSPRPRRSPRRFGTGSSSTTARRFGFVAANDVDAEEYEKFYKALAKEDKAPLAYTHFKAEGDVEFKAILFIPEAAPSDMFDNYYAKASALKLYVRRVFISDEFDELLPKYLSFIKGIVDSDTLPLNVSRETLQQHTSLKTIKKKLVRKALDMIRKLAEEGEPDEDDEDAAAAADADADDDTEETKYETFWKSFGKAIKLGIIEDASNRTRLAKLLRFYTSKSPTKLVSLEQYVELHEGGPEDHLLPRRREPRAAREVPCSSACSRRTLR